MNQLYPTNFIKISVIGSLVGLCQRAERPRRVRAKAPCGGFRTVVSPIPYWLTTVQSVDFFLADDNLDALKSTV